MKAPDLTTFEALIVCRILRWGNGGCFESNATLGEELKMDSRTVRRLVGKLIRKEWLTALYETKYRRILYVHPKRLTAGPLFENVGAATMVKMLAAKMSSKPVKSSVKSLL
ncbi:MAG: hypothetical protein PHH26_00545 [Candidatus Thermoplasmatota archaeon]|nr:hypothetical protein [Candidatus Thermoplasmatota archaeon]